jgi:hypothetical protein
MQRLQLRRKRVNVLKRRVIVQLEGDIDDTQGKGSLTRPEGCC